MILNEKPLVKRMNEDWKGEGYTVAGFLMDGDPWLGIVGIGYLVAVERSNAPRKVLAAIAEHAGELPGVGHAWLVQKKHDTQLADYDYTESTIRDLLDQEADEGLLARCRLTLGTRRLWQNTASGAIWLMDPEKTNIAAAPAAAIEPVGMWLRMKGTLSAACICRERVPEDDEKLLDHLKKVRWV